MTDPAADDEISRDTLRAWLAVFAVLTVLGALETARNYLNADRPNQLSLVGVAVATMPWWIGWALLVPAIHWFARRVRSIALHIAGAIVFASIHNLGVSLLLHSIAPQGLIQLDIGTYLARRYSAWILIHLVFYAAIVGVMYALEFARRYRDTQRAAERLQHMMAEARLQALQMELNPHFLFNTLNAIAGLIRTKENAAAVTMVARLSDLLRATLDRGSESETTLGEELALLELYLDVERCRFGERLQVSVTLPPQLAAARLPTFCLQPIVENAIRHGIAKHPGAGTVAIDARERDATLEVRVRNSGPQANIVNAARGIGLSNTESRLRERYGPARAGLALHPLPAGGAEATLWMPLELAS